MDFESEIDTLVHGMQTYGLQTFTKFKNFSPGMEY